jgi:PAT family beta-lactamase induction signal transducer AmpG
MDKFKRLFTDRTMLIVFAMGFSSGLPLLLTLSTMQAWLKSADISLAKIGLFSLVGLPYTLKFIWSPLLDRFTPTFLGRRRGWMVIAQVGLMLALLSLAAFDPKRDGALPFAMIALVITFMSATQDIGIDAYRREVLPVESFGFGNSLAITGYRLGMLVASSGALILAGFVSWPTVYVLMAGVMGLGLITTLLSPEPLIEHAPPRNLREAVVEPFKDFFSKTGAWWILAFILLYKVGDNMATALTTPFYLELKYTTVEIGSIGKTFGIWATIVGGLIGGTAMVYIGIKRSLWVFGILQGTANLSFAWLAVAVPAMSGAGKLVALATAISIENLTAGMGTAAYVAFMASLTNKRFTATQYALLSSLMGVPRVFIAAPTGFMVESLGWPIFFVVCTLCSIPGMLLLLKIGKWADAHDLTA